MQQSRSSNIPPPVPTSAQSRLECRDVHSGHGRCGIPEGPPTSPVQSVVSRGERRLEVQEQPSSLHPGICSQAATQPSVRVNDHVPNPGVAPSQLSL
jgi:hypothetical protein